MASVMTKAITLKKETIAQPAGALMTACIAAAGFFMLLARPQWFAGDAGVWGISDRMVRLAGHFVVYGLLSAILARALGRRLLLAFVVGAMLATAEEIHQLFVPYRFGCVSDWLVNLAGMAAFLGAYAWFLRPRQMAASARGDHFVYRAPGLVFSPPEPAHGTPDRDTTGRHRRTSSTA